mmetsp:Transcript_36517/g.60491  ORF Transcript_36517/g.60491 Transcript_36517/m.60491 type:complete len:96 (+) Transcript_36517:66-353(+)
MGSAKMCQLVVGALEDDIAVLTSDDLQVVRFPFTLLPQDVRIGCVLDVTVKQNLGAELLRNEAIQDVQMRICQQLGISPPHVPNPPIACAQLSQP